jgi:hypothetical protein
VVARNLYLSHIRGTESFSELRDAIEQFRQANQPHKPWRNLPM